MPDPKRCALYRHYDRYGFLLYIGISDDPVRRTSEHATRSEWVAYADHAKAIWFDTRAQAEAAERETIQREQPIFNVTHGVDCVELRISDYRRFRAAITGPAARIEHEQRFLGALMRGGAVSNDDLFYRPAHKLILLGIIVRWQQDFARDAGEPVSPEDVAHHLNQELPLIGGVKYLHQLAGR